VPAAGCERRDVSGFFVLRPETSLVIDVSGTFPIVLLRQGSPPAEWLTSGTALQALVRNTTTGLRISGGMSLISFRDEFSFFCGETQPCSGKDFNPDFSVGATYWVTPIYGAEVSYLRSGKATAEGSGFGFRFNGALDAEILGITGNVGLPIRRAAKLYVKAGMNYHEATFTTTQTVDDLVVTVDGVDRTFPGGTQTFAFRTGGWSRFFGGGVEVWLKPPFGFYADVGVATLKGSDLDGGDGEIDDRITFLLVGGRMRLGRFGR
jgi:hypothetical protein